MKKIDIEDKITLLRLLKDKVNSAVGEEKIKFDFSSDYAWEWQYWFSLEYSKLYDEGNVSDILIAEKSDDSQHYNDSRWLAHYIEFLSEGLLISEQLLNKICSNAIDISFCNENWDT